MTSLHPAAAGLDHIAEIALHSAGLADAAETNLTAPVESCPGWTMADLVDHVRQVHWFWATITEGPLPAPPPEAGRPAGRIVRPTTNCLPPSGPARCD